MKEKEVVSVRINLHEKQYLIEIAEKLRCFKRGEKSELSISKSLKILLEFCLHNGIDPASRKEDKTDHMLKMIEQIHASMPHLLYHNNFQSMSMTSNITDEKLLSIKQKNIDYMNGNFSGYKEITYQNIKTKLNNIGFMTLPLSNENLWGIAENT